VANIKSEMDRIEAMVQTFDATTLIGVIRKDIKDTFSEVTTSLETIAKDLC